MKKITYVVILFVGLVLFGCSKSKKFVVTPEDAESAVMVYSYNDVDKFFSLVPNTYEMTKKKDVLQIEVALVVDKKTKQHKYDEFGSFTLIPLNDKYKVIGKKVIFNACNGKEVVEQLFNSPEGTAINVSFEYTPIDKDEMALILDQISTCDIELDFRDTEFDSDNEEIEEVVDEDSYDHVMDMHIQAVIDGNEEIIMATTENMAEAQMEGFLTPEQEKRWLNIDAEIEQMKIGK